MQCCVLLVGEFMIFSCGSALAVAPAIYGSAQLVPLIFMTTCQGPMSCNLGFKYLPMASV